MTKKLLALLCCLVLTVGLFAGCGPDTAPIVTIDGIDFSVGEYLIYQLEAYNLIADRMSYTFNQELEDGTTPTVERQMEFYNNIDGSRVDVWITSTTLEELRMTIYYDRMMKEYGLEITDSDIADSKAYGEYLYEFYEQHYDGYYTRNGIGLETIQKWLINTLKEKMIFSHIYDKGGINETPEQEIKDAFNSIFGYMKMLSIPYYDISTGTPYSEEEVNDIDTYCKTVVERLNAGESIDQINREIVIGSGELPEGSELAPLEPQFLNLNESGYTSAMVDAYQAMDFGAAGYSKDTNQGFFYIYLKLDPMAEGLDYYDDYRYNTLLALKNDEFTADSMEHTGDYEIVQNVGLVKKYLPKNIERLVEE